MSRLWGANGDISVLDNQQRGSGSLSEKGIRRNVLVHITGNRATWEHMGMHGALWRINPERVGDVRGKTLQIQV